MIFSYFLPFILPNFDFFQRELFFTFFTKTFKKTLCSFEASGGTIWLRILWGNEGRNVGEH